MCMHACISGVWGGEGVGVRACVSDTLTEDVAFFIISEYT